jgi:hypothetical protein
MGPKIDISPASYGLRQKAHLGAKSAESAKSLFLSFRILQVALNQL